MKKGKKPIKDWDHHIDTHPEAAEFPSLLRKERTWQILRGQACYPAHPSWSLHACTWWHCGHLERFKVRPFQSRSGTRVFVGFPSGTSIKALPANAGHKRDSALILGWRRSPGAGNGNAVFLPGKSLGQRQLGRLHSMGSQRVRHDWAQIQSFYRQEEGATCRNSTDSSDGHLQVGGRWSEQHHLALWVQSGFSPRTGLPPFPRGRSWDLWQPVSWLQSTHRGVNFSTWQGGGLHFCPRAHGTRLTVLSSALEEELLKALDLWLNYFYSVLLDCFLWFCIFSLLWLNSLFGYSFSTDKRQAEDVGWARTTVSFPWFLK